MSEDFTAELHEHCALCTDETCHEHDDTCRPDVEVETPSEDPQGVVEVTESVEAPVAPQVHYLPPSAAQQKDAQ
jgi:hypothetical protein